MNTIKNKLHLIALVGCLGVICMFTTGCHECEHREHHSQATMQNTQIAAYFKASIIQR
jgi:hypothetical protein